MNGCVNARELLTVQQAANLAHVCRRTIYLWLKAGKLDTERSPSGRPWIYADCFAASPLRPLLTIREAMTQAGVCRRTIDNWLKAGHVTTTRTLGGSVRIEADSLLRHRPPSLVPVPAIPVPVETAAEQRRQRQHLEVLAAALGITVATLKRRGAEDEARRVREADPITGKYRHINQQRQWLRVA